MNVYHCISSFWEHGLLSQQLSERYTILVPILMNIYQYFGTFLLNKYSKNWAQDPVIFEGIRLHYSNSIFFVIISYSRKGITLSFISLKDLELGFFGLHDGLYGSLPIMLLLWLDHWPSHE